MPCIANDRIPPWVNPWAESEECGNLQAMPARLDGMHLRLSVIIVQAELDLATDAHELMSTRANAEEY
jgi:hypothetical protein